MFNRRMNDPVAAVTFESVQPRDVIWYYISAIRVRYYCSEFRRTAIIEEWSFIHGFWKEKCEKDIPCQWKVSVDACKI